MEHWKKLFQPRIWLRGVEYYEDGKVRLKFERGDCYTAVVCGSEDYDVEIRMQDDCILDMECSCPYAAEGNNCKHMAAVLIALEEEGSNSQEMTHPTPAELVKRIPEPELRSILTSFLEENNLMYRCMLLRYGETEQKRMSQISQLRMELELIPDQYEDRYGDIDYKNAHNFACEIADFIGKRVLSLAHTASVASLACIGWEAASLYCEHNVDDSDGGSYYVSNAIIELHRDLVALCSGIERKTLFQDTVKRYKGAGSHWFMAEIAWELLLSDIWDKELRSDQLQFLDCEITRQKESPEISEWQLQDTILARLNIMDQNDLAARTTYMDAHLDVPEICKCRAALYLQNHDHENAVRLLLQGKNQAREANHYGTEREFSHLLIDAYEQSGQKEQMILEMEYFLFHHRQENLDMLLRTKGAIPQAQWEELRGRYITRKGSTQKGELMRHEQMWDALMNHVIESNSVLEADRFEADLKGRFPSKMLEIYKSYLIGAAERASNRKAYYSLMPYMKKLCKYPDGTEIAAQLAADWRVRYLRRPAMMDELHRAGF